jgi:hypothetical protein
VEYAFFPNVSFVTLHASLTSILTSSRYVYTIIDINLLFQSYCTNIITLHSPKKNIFFLYFVKCLLYGKMCHKDVVHPNEIYILGLCITL